jgi:hypothetical protein
MGKRTQAGLLTSTNAQVAAVPQTTGMTAAILRRRISAPSATGWLSGPCPFDLAQLLNATKSVANIKREILESEE